MTDFVKTHLGIDFSNITYDDVEKFFAVIQEENTTLEFKSYNEGGKLDEKIKVIIRSVSAFLNSQGGLVIWGAPQEQRVNGIRVCHGRVQPLDQKFEKDFLISKISGNIIPVPNGITIIPLEKIGKYIYLIHVQQSSYRPHQQDNKYWMRLDAQTVPAPHHYVEALFKRVHFPDVKGELGFLSFTYSKSKNYDSNIYFKVLLSVKISNHSPFQNEENVGFHIICDNGKPLYATDKWPVPESIFPKIHPNHAPSYDLNVLHFGGPIFHRRAVGLNKYDLDKKGFKVRILLRFGGRYSPLKYSMYELDFSFFDDLKHIEGNVYSFDHASVVFADVLVADSTISSEEIEDWSFIDG